jgi:hypothetical protein
MLRRHVETGNNFVVIEYGSKMVYMHVALEWSCAKYLLHIKGLFGRAFPSASPLASPEALPNP